MRAPPGRSRGFRQLSLVASGAAFWLALSAFPAATAVVSVYGLVIDRRTVARDVARLVNGAPGSLGTLVAQQLQHVAATDSGRLTAGLLLSLLLSLWSASSGIYHLDGAIRDVFGLTAQRAVPARLRALGAAAVAVVVLGAVALVAGAVVRHAGGLLAVIVITPSAFVGLVATISGLYRFATGDATRWRGLLPGAIAAAAAMIVVLAGFGVYVSASTHFSATYGAFGAAVIGMTAMYIVAFAVLLGALLNARLAAPGEAGRRPGPGGEGPRPTA